MGAMIVLQKTWLTFALMVRRPLGPGMGEISPRDFLRGFRTRGRPVLSTFFHLHFDFQIVRETWTD